MRGKECVCEVLIAVSRKRQVWTPPSYLSVRKLIAFFNLALARISEIAITAPFIWHLEMTPPPACSYHACDNLDTMRDWDCQYDAAARASPHTFCSDYSASPTHFL
jgi:hypothetical protein